MGEKEEPSKEEIDAAVQSAAVLEKAAPETVKAEDEKINYWGNNFYCLFQAMKSPEKYETLVKTYLGREEAQKPEFQDFVNNNGDLLGRIYEVLDQLDVYESLTGLHLRFLRAGKFDEADAFNKRFDDKLGMNVFFIPLMKKLNVLLQEAAEKMAEYGIDYQKFWG